MGFVKLFSEGWKTAAVDTEYRADRKTDIDNLANLIYNHMTEVIVLCAALYCNKAKAPC